jgi:hypothetical protein
MSAEPKYITLEEWDDLVIETYGKPYAFQQQDGCKSRGKCRLRIPSHAEDYENTAIPERINGYGMGVSFSSWLDRHPKEWNGNEEKKYLIDMFWERNFYPHVQMLANDLHEKGLLEAGQYVIVIDW